MRQKNTPPAVTGEALSEKVSHNSFSADHPEIQAFRVAFLRRRCRVVADLYFGEVAR